MNLETAICTPLFFAGLLAFIWLGLSLEKIL